MSSHARRALLVLVAGAVSLGAFTGTATGNPVADEPEADLAHHGRIVYAEDGRLTMRLRTWNHGPVSLDSAAVRVSFSAPVEGDFPAACTRSSPSALSCETGPLRAGSLSPHPLDFTLRVTGTPAEAVVEVRTIRMSTAEPRPLTRDLNPSNDHQKILAPATNDTYYF